MGFGSCAARIDRTTGWRTGVRLDSASAARDWANYPRPSPCCSERLQGVSIERRPALQVMAAYDAPGTLFYVDPPYVHATRSPKRTRTAPSNGYTHELNDADHQQLLEQLLGMAGMVVLSGYAHPIYDRRWPALAAGRARDLADGARPRTEVLWINPARPAPSPRQLPTCSGRRHDSLARAAVAYARLGIASSR
jgi:DNA adenine methylase